MTLVLVGLDLLFFVFVPKTWMSDEENNTIWNGMKGLRAFAIFLSVLELALKVNGRLTHGPLVYFLWKFSQQVKNGPSSNFLSHSGL